MEVNLTVTYDYHRGPGHIQSAIVETLIPQHLDTREEAEAVVARFPKGLKLFVGQCSHTDGHKSYSVSMRHIKLAADGVNGERNETGIKRLASFLKAAERAGVTVTYAKLYSNQYETLEAGLAAAGIEA